MPRRKNLYHGTLLRNLPLIEEPGLVPRIGTFTKEFYGDAKGVVPAVFMADLKGLDRVVHAMVAGIMDEVTEEDFEAYDIGPHYHLNDELFYKYGVIFVIERDSSITLVGHSNADEPTQAEAGDWYALEVVRPIKAITGDDLCNFLAERDLTPSSINDFVDPFSVRSGTRWLVSQFAFQRIMPRSPTRFRGPGSEFASILTGRTEARPHRGGD